MKSQELPQNCKVLPRHVSPGQWWPSHCPAGTVYLSLASPPSHTLCICRVITELKVEVTQNGVITHCEEVVYSNTMYCMQHVHTVHAICHPGLIQHLPHPRLPEPDPSIPSLSPSCAVFPHPGLFFITLTSGIVEHCRRHFPTPPPGLALLGTGQRQHFEAICTQINSCTHPIHPVGLLEFFAVEQANSVCAHLRLLATFFPALDLPQFASVIL